jgi:hypothetical protein
LYQDKWQQGFREIRKAVLILVLIMCAYSVVEIAFFKMGTILARQILIMAINPFLYDVQSINYWWPPLLWKGQLRSICAEPSFFGIIATFTIPFLFSLYL